ncbi:hypothetical protein Hanom_Chr12g01148641 [Helianthus anomalus]
MDCNLSVQFGFFRLLKKLIRKPNRNFRLLKIRKPNRRFLFEFGFFGSVISVIRLRFGYFGFLAHP